MPRIHLFHGDDSQEPAGALRWTVNCFQSGYFHGQKLLPQGSTVRKSHGHVGICDGSTHSSSPHNRVVAMGDALDIHEVSRIGAHTRVITGVLAKGTFLHELIGIYFSLKNDLRMSGNGKVYDLALNHFHRFSTDGTGHIIFGGKG